MNASCKGQNPQLQLRRGLVRRPLARNIWDQALSGSDPVTDSSRTTSLASTANAKETATVAPADPTFYTLHVDVGTQEILT